MGRAGGSPMDIGQGKVGPNHLMQSFEFWGKTFTLYSQGSKEPLKVTEQVSDTMEENLGAASGKMDSPSYYWPH